MHKWKSVLLALLIISMGLFLGSFLMACGDEGCELEETRCDENVAITCVRGHCGFGPCSPNELETTECDQDQVCEVDEQGSDPVAQCIAPES